MIWVLSYEVVLWIGLLAPSGTPKDVIDKIATDSARVLKLPDVQERFKGLGLETGGTTPAEFEAFVKSETQKWGKVIKELGLTTD